MNPTLRRKSLERLRVRRVQPNDGKALYLVFIGGEI
jgi:hypothetical protein